jgi:prepilin-type processing-associated H-X9-DG protein
MMDNDQLLGLALNALEPAERDALRAQLADDTAAQVNLARIEKLLSPLAADKEHPIPPANLVMETLRKLDASRAQPRQHGIIAGRWLELAIAASIGLVAFGLVTTGINHVQAYNQRVACEENLRRLSAGLNDYAAVHNDHFPQVGQGDAPSAGHFRKLLDDDKKWPADAATHCAADRMKTMDVGYTYSLGHRAGDGIVGLRRDPETSAFTPIIADFPSTTAGIPGETSPHGRGHNVLFADGHSIFSLSPTFGDDNIFLNDAGLARAGLHPKDAVLGHPKDVP